MLFRSILSCLSLVCVGANTISLTEIFSRPTISRLYAAEQYALANADRRTGNRVNASLAASSIAGLKPSYVSGLIYFHYNTNLTKAMIEDFNVVRTAVLTESPNAKFDVVVNLDPHPIDGGPSFNDSAEVVALMRNIDNQLKLDAWWFDFYSNAQKERPEWIVAAIEYAHGKNQTVGGNVYGGVVPPSSDAVAFVDNPNNSTYGFGIDTKELAALKRNSSVIMLGHLNNNPQNGNATESCVYGQNWDAARRADYQAYWISQQSLGFIYMLPVFFPECPGAYSFNPLIDTLPEGITPKHNATLYDYIVDLSTNYTVPSNTSTSLTSSSVAPTASSSSAASPRLDSTIGLVTAIETCLIGLLAMI